LKFLKYIAILSIAVSCTRNESTSDDTVLADYILNRTIEKGVVIACAGSTTDASKVVVYQYPVPGSENAKLYETSSTNVDKNDYTLYTKVSATAIPFFNGYLEEFERDLDSEKWIIVTHELNGEIKLSNPIRTKQLSKASVWSDEVTINQEISTMPAFSWVNNQFGDNAIYFQIVSDTQNNLLSGTYTFENSFQYYDTSNVVLNITTNTPPELLVGSSYNFTLMDVSEDNWVNLFVLNKNFVVE